MSACVSQYDYVSSSQDGSDQASLLSANGLYQDLRASMSPGDKSVWKCGRYRIPLDHPLIMGIVNVTPDSFSDGGLHQTPDQAVAWACKLADDGADIIDVGGESTRPGALPVTCEEELKRVVPVVSELVERGFIVSIDTRHHEVARAACQVGAAIINDVSGFRDPQMVEVAAQTEAGLVVMHMYDDPQTMQCAPHYDDVVSEIVSYLTGQASTLIEAGIDPGRIMIDPGPGFGKTTVHDHEIQANFATFTHAGYPVAQATSRKRYLRDLSGIVSAPDRDGISAASALWGVTQGASLVRIHNVAQTHEALLVVPRPSRHGFVALGSNMGDSAQTIKKAQVRLDDIPLTGVKTCSRLYTSEPAYYSDQPLFVNTVVEIESRLPKMRLLEELLAIEQEFGRVRTIKDGPRTLDVDLIAYGGSFHAGNRLRLPHPLAHERDFVVKPLLDLISLEEVEQILGRPVLDEAERYGAASPLT